MRLFICLVALTIASCASTPPPAAEVPDPAVVNCTNACLNLHALQCRSGVEVKKCTRFCEKVMRSGYLTLPIDCICHARNKVEAALCGAECP